MIFSIKSKWDSSTSRLQWLVLRGAAVVARKATEREAKHVLNGLQLTYDPWQAFQDARQLRGI